MENTNILTHLFMIEGTGKNCQYFNAKQIDSRTTGVPNNIRLEVYRSKYKLRDVTEQLSLHINGKWKCLTALYSTKRENVYFGNILSGSQKTLLVIFLDREHGFIRIMEMPKGIYPDYYAILSLVNRL